MLTEQEIREALHASRVVPLSVPNPHGPLGLDHLAAAVAQLAGSPLTPSEGGRICRPLELSVNAWQKLEHLAATSARNATRPVSASEVAAAILEQVLAEPSPS